VPRGGVEPPTRGFSVRLDTAKLLNKLSVSQIAELSNLSKSYISQVKNGKRPPSSRLLQALTDYYYTTNKGRGVANAQKAIDLFLESRRNGISPRTTDDFYKPYLTRAIPVLGLTPTPSRINTFLNSLDCSPGRKHAYFRAIRVFYNWLYRPKSGYDLKSKDNPVIWVEAPMVPKLISPSLTRKEIEPLIDKANHIRDKAIITLFTESGLRLSELTNINKGDIDWQSRVIKVLGKGGKEAYAPFGELSEEYLREWLAQYQPDGNIWGMNKWGITSMLRRLEKETGWPCNPHTFRRTFACLLRKAGVDTMTIKDPGRWESLEMVQRYTRSVTFEDSLKFYKPRLG